MKNKPYAVCEEIINGVLSESYSIRYYTDTNPARFMVHQYCTTYDDAKDYIDYLMHPQDYFNIDI